jgi:hypothetical protein
MTQTGEARIGTLFTPDSANRALPYVRAVVEDLVAACRRLGSAEEARVRVLSSDPRGGTTPREREETLRRSDEERLAARETLDRAGRELEAVGVEVKDPESGLIDFPAEIEGRRAYLCWKRGEERVAFWHPIETGFAGRRPLSPPGGKGGDPAAAGETAPASSL